MAARIRKNHSDNTKGEIKATQLLNRLFTHANGECDMSSTQIQAAKIFIGKFKADLKAVELTGSNGGPVRVVAGEADQRL